MKAHVVTTFFMAATAAVAFTPVSVQEQPAAVTLEAPNACALLSRAEVRKATGATVGEGELRLRTATVTRCLFSGGSGGNAAILIRRIPSGDWESEQRGRLLRGVQFATYREMAGIGNRAFLNKMEQGSILCVFVGEYYLQISLFRMGDLSRGSVILEQLARSALTRLRVESSAATGATVMVNALRIGAQE